MNRTLACLVVGIATLTLVGCGRNDQPVQQAKPLPQIAPPIKTSPLPPARFWMAGRQLGCVLPNGDFTAFKFIGGMDAMVFGPNGFGAKGGVIPKRGERSFEVRTPTKTFAFAVNQGTAGPETHVLRFSDGSKEFRCFVDTGDGYIPYDNSLPQVLMIPGTWTCGGDVGSFTVNGLGRFKRGNVSGIAVYTSPNKSASNMQMHLLGNLDKHGVATIYQRAPMDASQVDKGILKIADQPCTKS